MKCYKLKNRSGKQRIFINEPAHEKRYLSHRRLAKAQVRLRISAVSSEPFVVHRYVVEILRKLQAKNHP